ncbi:phosphonate C-P lyase system protein PhnG [Alkalihalobacterium chitinilyticum]|uniref:Phosphonate C-P lyase system protein PhnG n=1 Tax=Alkalihalobacterium chitinilyticum TaxID=2980103 RepID=A0ABT5VH23_9BACI|nr:phosphonate C-P lyase system protein PhnG [Alkalihalobacterium chitinilyticum]MDE5414754.1 phosphonate C-P lyase system protein PhnG [Alkalihalobacterium chitinilyticum]
MKKSRLTKILVEGDEQFLQQLVSEVKEVASIQMERKPSTGLVMVKTRDSVSMQPFFMGEILVTECTVSINGKFGMGVIQGEQPKRSYQIAVIDATFNAKLPIVSKLLPKLENEEQKIRNKHVKEAVINAESRVHFDTMEDYNDRS